MCRFLALMLVCLLAGSGIGQEKVDIQLQQSGPKPGDLAAYKIGLDMGSQLAGGGLQPDDLNIDDFLAGFTDGIKRATPRATHAEIDKAVGELGKKIEARIQQMAKDNLVKATSFLDENKKQQGVVTLPSGLQYQIIKSGTGATPKAANTVSVHYEGKFIDGKVFDSSLKAGEPGNFRVDEVIPAWTEALTRMKVGDKWKLFVPPALGYREGGYPPVIPPNAALIFEMELLEVK